MSIKILIDSGTDLREEICQRVEVVPLTIRFGEKEYVDGVDLTHGEFYEKLVASEELPTTSQVTPVTFERAFSRLTKAGHTVVVITLSSGLSGTYQSAVIAAQNYVGSVYVVDSRNVAIGSGVLVEYALQLADEGKSAAEIAAELADQRENVGLVAMLDTLEYLKKGGRISATVAFAGGLLGIKPIIGVKDGKVVMLNKARGAKQATLLLGKEMEGQGGIDYSKPVLLGYTGADDSLLTKYMADSSALWKPLGRPHTTVVGSAVGTHAGPGAIAVAFFKKQNQ